MLHTDKLPGTTTVQEIALDIIEDLGLDNSWYKNIVRWIVRGFTELSVFHLETFEEAKLTPSSVGICTVPDDYVNWVMISYPYYGRNFTATRDGRFVTTTTTVTLVETQDTAAGEGVAIGDSSYWHYGDVGGKNQYRIEWINSRQFMINGAPALTTINLRYVSSGINASGSSALPVLCRESLITIGKQRVGERDKRLADSKYWGTRHEEELEKLRFAQFPTLDDLMDAIYETYTQTVKR